MKAAVILPLIQGAAQPTGRRGTSPYPGVRSKSIDTLSKLGVLIGNEAYAQLRSAVKEKDGPFLSSHSH